MVFMDRSDAGVVLANAILDQDLKDPVVVAIPKGGIVVGYEVARAIRCKLTMIISRKLPLPEDPEAGFGAIAENGSVHLVSGFERRVPWDLYQKIKAEQMDEIKRRIAILRNGRPMPSLEGKTAILVDDGIAMGSTMMASILCLRKKRPREVVVAAPVAGPASYMAVKSVSDRIVVLDIPEGFASVASAYSEWHDVPDDEALSILEEAKREGILLE